MEAASKARTVEVKPLETQKKGIGALLETYKKILVSRKKALNKLKQRRNHGNSPRMVWRRSWQSWVWTEQLITEAA
jgi:hypothetical protein